MHMIGQPYEETDPDLVVALLGPGEGPDDDLVHQGTGTEQETAVEGTAGDLDQGSSFGDEADSSAHTPEDGKSGPKLIRPRTAWVCEGGVTGLFSVSERYLRRALRELGGTSKGPGRGGASKGGPQLDAGCGTGSNSYSDAASRFRPRSWAMRSRCNEDQSASNKVSLPCPT